MGMFDHLSGAELHELLPNSSLLIEAVNNYDRFARWTYPYIAGIEVTQGIQYYKSDRHLTDPNDRGADNSVRLVAFKPAWVRVYVRTGIFGNNINVTGNITVQSQVFPPLNIWQEVGTLTPMFPGNTTTRKSPDYDIERRTLNRTLNYIIPQNDMSGMVRLVARIWGTEDEDESVIDTHTLVLNVTLRQTLSLRGIMISYNGPDPTVNPANPPNINLAAPTLANLQNTAAWTLTTNPVESNANFSIAGTLNWTTPLTGVALSPGGCSQQWLDLNTALAQIRTNDGNRQDVIYYGLLPAGTPIANVGGCRSSGISAGPNGQQVTMAHEIGHGAGLQHGPCGTPGDPNYPAYEPYDPANTPMASIGEYGLNVNTGIISAPDEKDYMSYCIPRWISLYHHGRLINNQAFNPRTVGSSQWVAPELVDPYLWPWEYIPDPPPWERFTGDPIMQKAQPVISLIGIVNENREFDVQSVMRVMALPSLQDAARTPYVAQLIGEKGEVVASAPVMRLNTHGCGCGCDGGDSNSNRDPYTFQALIPDIEPGTALRIVQQGQEVEEDREVWLRKSSGNPPEIGGFQVRISKGKATAKWDAGSSSERPLNFALQFSKDNGRSWNSVAVNITDYKYQFDISDLPGGITVIFRLLAHDGFLTTTADSNEVRLPERALIVSIMHPHPEQPILSGFNMRLWAAINT